DDGRALIRKVPRRQRRGGTGAEFEDLQAGKNPRRGRTSANPSLVKRGTGFSPPLTKEGARERVLPAETWSRWPSPLRAVGRRESLAHAGQLPLGEVRRHSHGLAVGSADLGEERSRVELAASQHLALGIGGREHQPPLARGFVELLHRLGLEERRERSG